jgi:hypothetical protein
VYEWTEKFKNGVTSVDDSPRPGPAFTAVTDDNIAAVENEIWENWRVTVKEVASLWGISVGSAHHYWTLVLDHITYVTVPSKFPISTLATAVSLLVKQPQRHSL